MMTLQVKMFVGSLNLSCLRLYFPNSLYTKLFLFREFQNGILSWIDVPTLPDLFEIIISCMNTELPYHSGVHLTKHIMLFFVTEIKFDVPFPKLQLVLYLTFNFVIC